MTSHVKELRDSRAAQSSKLRKLGAQGNLKMARKGEHAERKYHVPGYAYADGGAVVDGMPSKPRLDRPGRKMGKGKDKKAGTNVNVIVMPKGGADAAPAGPMPGPGPMAGPPPMPPPGPGPGGPPMPMRKDGGKVMSKAEDEREDRKIAAAAMHRHERVMHHAKKLTKFRKGGAAKGCK